MRCDEARPLISVALDGELDAPRRRSFEAHVDDCAACTAERELLESTVRLLRFLPESEPPPDLRRRIGVALMTEEQRVARRQAAWAWLARPQSAGWTWGAAVGGVAATVALVSMRGPAPATRAVTTPPETRTQVVTPAPSPSLKSAPLPVRTANRPPSASPATAALPTPSAPTTPALPHSITVLRTPKPPVPPRDEAAPTLVVAAPASPDAPRSARSPVSSPRRSRSATTAKLVANTVGRGSKAPVRTAAVTSHDPAAAHPTPPASVGLGNDTGAPPPTGDTSGMTQMASGDPESTAPASPADDLTELRTRLRERELPLPQLGTVPGSREPRHEGWIRF